MRRKSIVTLLKNKKRYLLFLVLTSFVVTFIIIRIVTHLQLLGVIPNQDGPLHIHHMVVGIIILLIAGFIAVGFDREDKHKPLLAVLYGIGAALTIDEFALWLFLKDVYWQEEGRNSIIAVIIVLTLIVIGIIINEVTEGDLKPKMTRRKSS